MKALIVNFRVSRTRQKDNHMILQADSIDNRDKAMQMVGKKVVFKTETGKEIIGSIASAHGNKGALRAVFDRGLPGQALGKEVEIIDSN